MNKREQPPWLWPQAAYIHVPFCAHHCGYCDFAVATGQDHQVDRYIEAITAELSTLGEPQPVRTIFLGGGTPSHLDARQLTRLLSAVTHWLPLLPDHEFSIEANPDTVDFEKVTVLTNFGVNRVSLGAQSFHTNLLRVLERQHDPNQVARAIEQIRRRIDNVSLDLIFGVPGQRLAEWQADLQQALRFEPAHLSTYGLTYEKGTRLWKQRERGELRALEESDELALYSWAIDALETAGFEHYEISNFARPGRQCRHNQVYWANHAYFGFGMGAACYIDGRRDLNTRDLHAYIRHALAGESVTMQSESLEPEDRARETMAIQLRRAEGINRSSFHEQTGYELDALAGAAIARLIGLGLLGDDSQSVRLTRRGKSVADTVIRELM